MAVCASGEGTAQKLKDIIEKVLVESNDSGIKVMTCSVADLETKISEWQKKYTIIASTGIVDPKIQAPFIPLERFIEDKPEQLLKKIISLTIKESMGTLPNKNNAQAVIYSYVEENFAYINPKKIVPILWTFVNECGKLRVQNSDQYAFHINLAFHMAGLIERQLQNEQLNLEKEEQDDMKDHPLYPK